MNRAHEQLVDAQFGPRAQAYVESAVHARGPDLEALREVVSAVRPARALDLGTGGGHVAYLMADYAGSVTASDLSREMLAAVAAAAKDRDLSNVEVAEAYAERLTFENEWFDFLGCRYSAHHWRNLEAGLREARRVLKHGCKAVFIDAFAPEVAALDTH
jgi:ubiquinone/menaquinone biosynthesis C-methylase UbiE